jgi:Dolichyl-phosphate-mannose-protein mannosyltransferase
MTTGRIDQDQDAAVQRQAPPGPGERTAPRWRGEPPPEAPAPAGEREAEPTVTRSPATEQVEAPAAREPAAGPAAAPARPAAGGLLERLWSHRVSLVLLLATLAVVAVVQAVGMDHAPQRVDDEGTYVAQAWAVQHWRTLAHYTYWYDHPPLGWLLLAAWTTLTGAFSRAATAVSAGRELMLVIQVVSAALLYALARRLGLRRPAAVACVLLFSLSPLALSFHRAVYLDNLATPFLLGAFVLILSPSRRLAAHAGAGLCFAAAVLTKETSLLLMPALLWQYWQVNDQRNRRYSLAVAASLFLLVVAVYPLTALLRGELLPGPEHVSLVDAIRFQLAGRASGGSAFDPNSVNRHTIDLWLSADPWLLAGAALLIPAGLWIRRLRPVTVAFAILAAVTLRPGYLPIPLVIGMLPFASLLVAGVADTAAAHLAGRGRSRQAAHAGHLAGSSRSGRATADGHPAGSARRRRAVAAGPLAGSPGSGRVAGAVAMVAVVVVALLALPRWYQGDRDLMTVDHDKPFRQAEAWINGHVPHRGRLLVDDSLWVDLVQDGYPPGQVVWFYKLDTDRDVRARYPRGWRDFDYVVSAATLRAFPDRLPQVAEAVRHSRPVASFGHGAERVEIRRIQGSPV